MGEKHFLRIDLPVFINIPSKIFLFALVFALVPVAVFAQEEAPSTGEVQSTEDMPPAEETKEEIKLSEEEIAALKAEEDAKNLLDMEIKTSNLKELVALCRELGLSEGGNKEDLIQRLRSHYKITVKTEETSTDQKVITIDTARSTEYFTIKSVDEEYARLSGGVQMSLNDGVSVHKIQADEILFNRTRNVITSFGHVQYTKEENDTLETFKGEAFTMNLDTWAGSFIDTVSERTVAGSETAYKFAGQVMSKTGAETTVLKKAHVTNAKSDEPFWSIDASKLWILPGSDWALLNVVIKLGTIPIFWLPAFYFPADEIVFHPVMGTKPREGAYLQTTTYIFGRPGAEAAEENSISKILGSGAGMERKRHGVFLRTTGKKETAAADKKFAILLDAYTNLGFYVGTEIALPAWKIIGPWTFSGGFAFTRSVFSMNTSSGTPYYTPFNPIGYYPDASIYDELNEEDRKDDWNKSYIFGTEVPFRYRLKTGISISGKAGSASLNLPIYSDPFVNWDTVSRRKENMDLMALITSSSKEEEETPTTDGAYQWELQLRPNLSTQFFAPYISSMSISSISSVFGFNYKNDVEVMEKNNASPSRTFFYPDKWTIASISGSMSGSPITKSTSNTKAEKDKEVEDPLKNFGIPRAPWEELETASSSTAKIPSAGQYDLVPPALSQVFTIGNTNALKFTWSYQLTPNMTTELFFSSAGWKKQSEIDLNDLKSISMLVNLNGSTNITISEPNNNLFSVSGGLTGSLTWKDHLVQEDMAEEYITEPYVAGSKLGLKNTEKLEDLRNSTWTTSWTGNAQINPFYWLPLIKTTNLQYSISGLLAKSKFVDALTTADSLNSLTYIEEPEYETIYGEWNNTDISTHSIGSNIGISVFDKIQNLTLALNLPPKDSQVTLGATARFWITETNVNTSIRDLFYEIPMYNPINFTEKLTFGKYGSITQNVTYTPQYEKVTNVTSALALTSGKFGNFNFNFNAGYTTGYEIDWDLTKDPPEPKGWKTRLAKEIDLRPISTGITYSYNYKKDTFWDGRIGFSINTNLGISLDLQRFTYSKLTFNLNATLMINKFLDFTLGTSSENNQMFFYMSSLFGEDAIAIKDTVKVYEDNFFIDLINSFRFDNDDIRRQSGFKLKNFNFSLVHHLGDWDASLTVTMNPWRDTIDPKAPYTIVNSVSFTVQWLPITELKTDLTYDGTANRGKGLFTAK
ncbi:MAG: LPS-assembly protein LptD [Termitinemataceae bacterium]|nr:MAG: LPS-assembly protein LptD [Termitinemataceae bacterium]